MILEERIIKFLAIAHKKDLDALKDFFNDPDNNEATALIISGIIPAGRRDEIENEEASKRGFERMPPLLFTVCKEGQSDYLKVFLKEIDPNILDLNAPFGGETALSLACRFNQLEIVKLLLEDDRVDVNAIAGGNSPLSIACKMKNKALFELLVSCDRLDINQSIPYTHKDGVDDTIFPFMISCELGDEEIVDLLLKHPKFNINKITEYDEYNGFFSACAEGHLSIVKKLLQRRDLDKTACLKITGDNAIGVACAGGQTEVLKELLNDAVFSSKIDKVNNDGYSPWLLACSLGQYDVVKVLLENNANIDIETAFVYASAAGALDLVKYLLETSPYKDKLTDDIIFRGFAVTCDNPSKRPVFEFLLQHPLVDINMRDSDNMTPLMLACENRNIEAILDLSIDPRLSDEDFEENKATLIEIYTDKAKVKNEKFCLFIYRLLFAGDYASLNAIRGRLCAQVPSREKEFTDPTLNSWGLSFDNLITLAKTNSIISLPSFSREQKNNVADVNALATFFNELFPRDIVSELLMIYVLTPKGGSCEFNVKKDAELLIITDAFIQQIKSPRLTTLFKKHNTKILQLSEVIGDFKHCIQLPITVSEKQKFYKALTLALDQKYETLLKEEKNLFISQKSRSATSKLQTIAYSGKGSSSAKESEAVTINYDILLGRNQRAQAPTRGWFDVPLPLPRNPNGYGFKR
jgi:ankyrin repeat protein